MPLPPEFNTQRGLPPLQLRNYLVDPVQPNSASLHEKSSRLFTGTVLGPEIRLKLFLLKSPAFRRIHEDQITFGSEDIIQKLVTSITRNPHVRIEAIKAGYSNSDKTEKDPNDLQPNAAIYDTSELNSNAAVYDKGSNSPIHTTLPNPLYVNDLPNDARSVFTLEGIHELEGLIMAARKWGDTKTNDAPEPYKNPKDPKIASNPLALAWFINPGLIFEVKKTKVKIADCAEKLTRIDIIVGEKNGDGLPDTIHNTLILLTKYDNPENIARMKKGNSLEELKVYYPDQKKQKSETISFRRR